MLVLLIILISYSLDPNMEKTKLKLHRNLNNLTIAYGKQDSISDF